VDQRVPVRCKVSGALTPLSIDSQI
jgi:hypothetical protein